MQLPALWYIHFGRWLTTAMYFVSPVTVLHIHLLYILLREDYQPQNPPNIHPDTPAILNPFFPLDYQRTAIVERVKRDANAQG